MADKNWGNCKRCRYFSADSHPAGEKAVASCQQSTLKTYALKVSEDSGCNAFEARVAAPEQAPAPQVH